MLIETKNYNIQAVKLPNIYNTPNLKLHNPIKETVNSVMSNMPSYNSYSPYVPEEVGGKKKIYKKKENKPLLYQFDLRMKPVYDLYNHDDNGYNVEYESLLKNMRL